MYEIDPIIAFALILIIAFTIPEAIRRLKVSYVPFYIIAGIILGPFGIGFQSLPAFDFIADIGLFMLVFIAGLEIYGTGVKSIGKSIKFSIISASICFAGGFFIGLLLEYPLLTNLLIGTIMMSSSVGEIIPIVQTHSVLREKFGHFIIPTIVIMDTASLFILAFIVQLKLGAGPFSYVLFIVGSILIILLIIYAIPRIAQNFFSLLRRKPVETDLRFVLTLLLVMVAIGELIHLHGIVVSFLVGIVLGKYIDERTHAKLYGFGYGFFIPLFFIILGMKMDISILAGVESIGIALSIIGVLIICKIIGGLIFAKSEGFTAKNGLIMGIMLWPQLSATLAATAVGFEVGIFDQRLLISIVIMSMFTVTSTEFVVRMLIKEEEEKHAFNRHTVVVGYGRNSALIANLLKIQKKALIVIESNISIVEEIKKAGIEVIYGDGADKSVLRKAGIEGAETAIITIPDEHEEYLCLRAIKELNPDCYTVSVVHTVRQSNRLKDEKLADYVIWPEKLSSVEIADHLFRFRGGKPLEQE